MTTPESAPSALARCVGDRPAFIDGVWARSPLHRPGADPSAFADLIDIAGIDHLIGGAGLRFPALKIVHRGRTLPATDFTVSGRVGGVAVDDLVDPTAVYDQFARGATVVLASLHRYWPPLARFCRDLEAELSHPVQANLYLTPPEAQGLNLHYDTHDVFVLHLHGAKRWQIFEQAVEAPLAHQHGRVDPDDPGDLLLAEVLIPGDALYVPRGFVHAATTEETASAHLTIGVLAVTWMDLLHEVVREAEGDPTLRAALPPGFARAPAEDLAVQVRATLDRVAQRAAGADAAALAERLLRRAGRRFAAAPCGQLQRLLALDAVGDGTLVRPRPEVAIRVRNGEAQLILELADRSIAMPARVGPALRSLLAPDGVEVSELSRWLDADGRLVLVRRLIREGVLEADGPP